MSDTTMSKVLACLAEVFENKGLAVPELSADTPLDSSLGLQSLDYAELVVRLEDEFDIDPFDVAEPPQVNTVAELTALYEDA